MPFNHWSLGPLIIISTLRSPSLASISHSTAALACPSSSGAAAIDEAAIGDSA